MVTQKTRKWSLLSPCGAADLVVTEKMRIWSLLSPCIAADLAVTEKGYLIINIMMYS